MKILVIGASSYIGARIYSDIKDKYEIVGTYAHHAISPKFIYLDITNYASVKDILVTQKPDIVIHLSNYSSSRFIAGNEENFIRLNLEATKSLIKNVEDVGAKFIFFSSMAATTKLDLYGELKVQIEEIISKLRTDHFVIRPSAVIGISPNHDNNKVTDKIISVIRGGREEFDTSWTLQPTYIGHISQLIDQIISKDIWNKTINLFTNHPITQFQIAIDILAHFSKTPTPIDKGLQIALAPDNTKELTDFSLIPSTYPDIIETIVEEIKHVDRYQL